MAINQRLRSDTKIQTAIARLLETGEWSAYEGDSSRSLQTILMEAHDRSYVHLCCSGTFAVELALRGLRLNAEDEVILAAYDFPGNFRAIEAIGARPVLVDIAPGSWCLDADELDAAFSNRVRAIIVSHLHGTLADMKRICDWAQTRSIAVIEDACQAHGAFVQGKPAGSWGDVSVLSFGGSKLISSGRGGAVMTSDPRIDQRMRIFRERGNDAFPMSELQACVIIPQWEQLHGLNLLRWQTVQRIESALAEVDGIQIAERRSGDRPSFYKWGYQVRLAPDKDPLLSLEELAMQRVVQLQQLRAHMINCGEGFRGFALRGDQRCRSVGRLNSARKASAGTVVIHHSELEPLQSETIAIEELLKKGSEYRQ